MTIEAPFTLAQVNALNAYQQTGTFHPYTCINRHDGEAERVLVAYVDGFRCPTCNYRQTWAHPVGERSKPLRLNPAQVRMLDWACKRGGRFREDEAYRWQHFGYDRLRTLVKRGLLMREGRYEYAITDLTRDVMRERGLL